MVTFTGFATLLEDLNFITGTGFLVLETFPLYSEFKIFVDNFKMVDVTQICIYSGTHCSFISE